MSEDPKQVVKESVERWNQDETGFSRLVQVFRGDLPHVYTLGVIGAEKPMERPSAAVENRDRTEGLRQTLAGGGYAFRRFRSVSGIPRTSFLVINIPRDFLVRLCKHCDQQHALFGLKTRHGFNFDLLTPDGKAVLKRHIVLSRKRDILIGRKCWGDFCSKLKGRTLPIPFCDSDTGTGTWGKSERGNVESPVTWESSEILASRPDLKDLVGEIRSIQTNLDRYIMEGRVGFFMVVERAGLRRLVWKLEEALEQE